MPPAEPLDKPPPHSCKHDRNEPMRIILNSSEIPFLEASAIPFRRTRAGKAHCPRLRGVYNSDSITSDIGFIKP